MKKRKKIPWGNIVFVFLLIVLIVPTTRKPIQVTINRIFAFAPDIEEVENRKALDPFEYALVDLDGNQKRIAVGNGKPVLINYWATWCPPCVAEMPSLQKLYDAYGQDVDFLFITTEDPDVVKSFLEDEGYDLMVYRPAMVTPAGLYEQSIPTTFLIDKNGGIAVKKSGAALWDSDAVVQVIKEMLDGK